MMNQTESFGARLAQLRRDAGLSQQGLAQALSVTRQAVSNWERDQTVPDLDMLRSIAAALGTDMNTLCGMDVLPRRKPRRVLPRPALALSLCAAFCLGAGLGLWSSRTPPEPVPDATVSTTLSAHRTSYTTPSGIKVTTAADGALEVSDELAALPEQDPGPVELTAQLRDDFSYFAQQYVLRFLPDYQDGAFLSDWDDVLLWCYRSGCSDGDIMAPQTVADYLTRFFGYEEELPALGTEQFPMKSGGYYPECGAFTTSEDVYTLSSLELLEDGTYRALLQAKPYGMTLELTLSPTDDGLLLHSALKTYGS